MESSGPSPHTPDPLPERWAGLLGMTIAILTLLVPTLAIAYYSSPTSPELPKSEYMTKYMTSNGNRGLLEERRFSRREKP